MKSGCRTSSPTSRGSRSKRRRSRHPSRSSADGPPGGIATGSDANCKANAIKKPTCRNRWAWALIKGPSLIVFLLAQFGDLAELVERDLAVAVGVELLEQQVHTFSFGLAFAFGVTIFSQLGDLGEFL